MNRKSPDHVKISMAAAMTLGLKSGLFYRNAKLYCINLLQTYPEGCRGNCAYCGLSRSRPIKSRKSSFIRVEWPVVALEEILSRIRDREDRIERICLSMVTHTDAADDAVEILRRIRTATRLPVSILMTPTCLSLERIEELHDSGADRCGIAMDAARQDLFERFRGCGVRGPHKWDKYWECVQQSVGVFGRYMTGIHWIVGLGETEKEMVEMLLKTRESGAVTHLFSFFPEPGSGLEHHPQPPMGTYRRMQLARYLIDHGLASRYDFDWDAEGRTILRVDPCRLNEIVRSGHPFETSGCPGTRGRTACNRPYANCLPGPDIRNYPFPPEPEDIQKIIQEGDLTPPGGIIETP